VADSSWRATGTASTLAVAFPPASVIRCNRQRIPHCPARRSGRPRFHAAAINRCRTAETARFFDKADIAPVAPYAVRVASTTRAISQIGVVLQLFRARLTSRRSTSPPVQGRSAGIENPARASTTWVPNLLQPDASLTGFAPGACWGCMRWGSWVTDCGRTATVLACGPLGYRLARFER